MNLSGRYTNTQERLMEDFSYTCFTAGNYMNQQLVRAVRECQADCEHMAGYIMREPDYRARVKQASLLKDCADVCSLTANYAARGSAFSRQAASLLADVCESCGRESANFQDCLSQDCANICARCAKECERFTGAV